MKRWVFWGFILLVLACLAALSSRRPDAIQNALGLPGGVEGVLKSAGGILATAAIMMIIAFGLSRLRRRR